MRDWLKTLGFGAVGCLVLALVLILFVVIAPLFLGSSGGEESGLVVGIKLLLPLLAMLLIILGGLFFAAVWLVAFYEIVTAKNDGSWRVLWALIVVFLGAIGVVLYLAVARKERKQ